MPSGTIPLFNWSLTYSSWLFSALILKIPSACRPPWVYNCLCSIKSIVGTLFPLESNESCMDSVETPKTVALALGALLGTSGSNSTGKPRNPSNLSKVTWATCVTLVGNPISMAQSSLLPAALIRLHPTIDLLKAATKSSTIDS
uniref:Uncharacterized protein n=1 Tax=Rhizophora mucronata TaxID=61149 RepID=A0A2P2QNU2_RHIMU